MQSTPTLERHLSIQTDTKEYGVKMLGLPEGEREWLDIYRKLRTGREKNDLSVQMVEAEMDARLEGAWPRVHVPREDGQS